MKKESELVTPAEVLGNASDCKAGKGAHTSPHNSTVYASLTELVSVVVPDSNYSPDQGMKARKWIRPLSFLGIKGKFTQAITTLHYPIHFAPFGNEKIELPMLNPYTGIDVLLLKFEVEVDKCD